MKLLLDTRWLTKIPSGVGNTIANIISGLEKETNIQTTFFGNYFESKKHEHISHIPLSGIKKKFFQFFWREFFFPKIELVTGKHDLVHYTNATAIPQKHGKYILTVHDLSYVEFAKTIESKNLFFLQRHIPWSIQKADHIIAVSNHTKENIIKYFKIPEDKITVIYNGIDKIFFENHSQKLLKLKKKHNLKNKYFLSVSTIEPRKDYITQIKAYKKLPENIRKEYDLIIAGGTGWKSKEVITEVKKEMNIGNIKLLGYVPELDISCLMQNASLYIHSSLDEGFGLPLIQALASKCHVIASNTSCHPEILQEHATYFEVQNVNDLVKTIQKKINHPQSSEQKEAGYEYAKQFSTKNMVTETIELYKQLLSEKK